MATSVVCQDVFVRDELVEVRDGAVNVPQRGADDFVATCDGGEDLVGGGGGEAEDGGEGVEGVEGGDGVVEEQVEFAGEVRCGLDQGGGGDDVGVDGAGGEGG